LAAGGSGQSPVVDVLARVDGVVGGGIERAVAGKHRLRLRRLGWSRALEPSDDGPFAAGDPPPRTGCGVEVLIDGAQALPRIASAIRDARRSVWLTGWHLAPHFELDRCDPAVAIGPLLAEVAERGIETRVLVWAGAPIRVFHPTRAEVRAALETLTRGTRIRAEPDPREHPFHCHHEKTVIVDGEVAFVNGIDLTDESGDRFDSSGHPSRRRLGWHDVGTRLTGPVVDDVAAHFAMRWQQLTGERLARAPAPAPAGDSTVQVVRTVAEGMYDAVPRGDFRILEAYVRAIRSAQRLIYLENQFLWAPEIVAELARKLRRPPSADFRLVILLPRRANNGQDDTRGQLGLLVDADDGAGRFLAATIRSRSGERSDPLYVHAKVGIFDDERLIVGSANLNEHSLLNDTEMCIVTDDAALVRETRERLWSEHLERDATGPPAELVDEAWIPIATEQLERERRGEPPTHRLLGLPGVSRRARRLLGPLSGLLDDG
jgi:phosphatidylserine/phosphatidylglycerophosphate/cardiolipin synthase-like enzyme